MLEWLIATDKALFLWLNSLGHPHLDGFMLWMSHKFIWIPLYAYLIYRLYRQYKWQFYIPLLLLILVIVIADQGTSGFMKPFFERPRPCHEPSLQGLMTLVGGCGGHYGFASSHAANTIGLAMFFVWMEKTRFSALLLLWALLVSYSRIHLGVHYPGDVLVGGLVGAAGAWICSTAAQMILLRVKAD